LERRSRDVAGGWLHLYHGTKFHPHRTGSLSWMGPLSAGAPLALRTIRPLLVRTLLVRKSEAVVMDARSWSKGLCPSALPGSGGPGHRLPPADRDCSEWSEARGG
jgi:hypothetical protein